MLRAWYQGCLSTIYLEVPSGQCKSFQWTYDSVKKKKQTTITKTNKKIDEIKINLLKIFLFICFSHVLVSLANPTFQLPLSSLPSFTGLLGSWKGKSNISACKTWPIGLGNLQWSEVLKYTVWAWPVTSNIVQLYQLDAAIKLVIHTERKGLFVWMRLVQNYRVFFSWVLALCFPATEICLPVEPALGMRITFNLWCRRALKHPLSLQICGCELKMKIPCTVYRES